MLTKKYRLQHYLCLILLALSNTAFTQTFDYNAERENPLNEIINDQWQDTLARDPVFASSIGDRRYDTVLQNLSPESMKEAADFATALLQRLDQIPIASLTSEQALNASLLKRELHNRIEAVKHTGRYMIITNRSGWHINFARLPERTRFFTRKDYENYIARLHDFPRLNQEGMDILQQGINTGYTHTCESMFGYETSIDTHIVENVSDSVFMLPFQTMPDTITREEQASLTRAASIAVNEKVIPAYRQLYAFYTQQYAPKCREQAGLYGLPGAKAYYQFLAKRYTTTDMSPNDIHKIGKSEVKRITAEMETVIQQTGFDGNRKAFIHFLRTDPQFYPKTPEEHLRHAAFLSKKADGELPKLFKVFPRMPYSVKAVPQDIAEKTTTAYYERPAGDGTRAGVYRVNLSKLDTRPSFEMEALTLHEAVPGHHFQIALSQELDSLPEFRRYGSVTAFAEGWGLYAERLGLEMGFYKDPYANFGRLSYEMWRACRLVVDTGIHTKGWSRERAIEYMAEHTALSLHNIESEIDRYITWPGQALAYKIGELKIRELRANAEKALGKQFDVRDFHDTVLKNGPVPLNVLEQLIDTWIKSRLKVEKAKA